MENRRLEREDYAGLGTKHRSAAEIFDTHAAGAPEPILILARALYGLERMKDHRALGDTYPIAPLYIDLAQGLAGNAEARHDIVKMLEAFDV